MHVDDEVKARLDVGVAMAIETAPYARDVMSAVRYVFTGAVQAMACDKYWRIYTNPDFVRAARPEELAWIILHECLGHLLRDHAGQAIEYDNKMRTNIAQDLEIESWEWPDGPAMRPTGIFAGLHPEKFDLPVGMTWQWYYNNLPKELEDMANCGSGAHGVDQEWELGEAGAPVKPGDVKARAIRRATAKAIKKHAEIGNVPAGLEVWADVTLSPPHIDWRSVLRSFVSSCIAAGCVDMIGPPRENVGGMLVPRWRSESARVVIVADTSGSMSSMGGMVLGACVDICRVAASVDVCWVDITVKWQRRVRCKSELKPAGGGGTNLSPAIMEARSEDPDAIIIITDCHTPWPEPCNQSMVLALGNSKPPKGWRYINVRESNSEGRSR